MSSFRRDDVSEDAPEVLTPSEVGMACLAGLIGIVSSWWNGGMRLEAQEWILGLSVAGMLLLPLRLRERRALRLMPFLPLVLWAAFALTAALNPSHEFRAKVGWIPREGYVRWLPSTADVAHTVADARLWLPALILGALSVLLLRTARVVRAVWAVLALNGFVLAAVGALFHFSGATRVLGIIDPPEPTYFFATFFYKNHWAAFGAVASIASFTLALRASRAAGMGDPSARGRWLLFTVTGLLTAITLPLPGSRSGVLLATVIVAGYFGALLVQAFRRREGRANGGIVAGGTLLIAGLVTFGAYAYAPKASRDLARTKQELSRRTDGEAMETRMLVSRDTWRMALARPWLGWGPGAFEVVYPAFQGAYLRDASGRPTVRFEFAHNDWLQLIAEGGFIGAALLLVPAALVSWRGWRRADFAGRWALAGCALLAAYASIDFPFHNPAMLLLWVILLTSAHRLRSSRGADSPT